MRDKMWPHFWLFLAVVITFSASCIHKLKKGESLLRSSDPLLDSDYLDSLTTQCEAENYETCAFGYPWGYRVNEAVWPAFSNRLITRMCGDVGTNNQTIRYCWSNFPEKKIGSAFPNDEVEFVGRILSTLRDRKEPQFESVLQRGLTLYEVYTKEAATYRLLLLGGTIVGLTITSQIPEDIDPKYPLLMAEKKYGPAVNASHTEPSSLLEVQDFLAWRDPATRSERAVVRSVGSRFDLRQKGAFIDALIINKASFEKSYQSVSGTVEKERNAEDQKKRENDQKKMDAIKY